MAVSLTTKYLPGVARGAITAASTWEVVHLPAGARSVLVQFADSGDTAVAGRVALDDAGISGDFWSVAAGQSIALPVAAAAGGGSPSIYVYCATASAYVQAVLT